MKSRSWRRKSSRTKAAKLREHQTAKYLVKLWLKLLTIRRVTYQRVHHRSTYFNVNRHPRSSYSRWPIFSGSWEKVRGTSRRNLTIYTPIPADYPTRSPSSFNYSWLRFSRLKVRWHTERAAMSAREITEFCWTTFRPVFDDIRL